MRFIQRLFLQRLFLARRLPAVIILALIGMPAAHAYTVLVVGDSISAAYGLNESQGWVQLAEKELAKDVPDIEFINASISGDTTVGGAQRIDAALERFAPDLLIVELGGNDGLRGYPPAQMQENLEAMANAASQTGAEVLILGMMIPSNYGAAYTRQFGEAFERAANNSDAALVPFLLEPIATDRQYFQKDGIHPTADAQPLLAEHVLPAIRAILDQRDP